MDLSPATLKLMAQAGVSIPPGQIEVDGLVGLTLIEAAQKSDVRGLVPAPVSICAKYIQEHGLDVEGIFRRSGNLRRTKDLLSTISNCFLQPNGGGMESASRVLENGGQASRATVHDVCNMLMRYLRGMPEPLLTNRLSPIFAKAIDAYSHAKDTTEDETLHKTLLHQIQILLKLLPACNRATLLVVVDMCAAIVAHSSTNLMTSLNIGLCIGCTIAQPETLTFILDHKEAILDSKLGAVDVAFLEKAVFSLGMGQETNEKAGSGRQSYSNSRDKEEKHRSSHTVTAAQMGMFRRMRDSASAAAGINSNRCLSASGSIRSQSTEKLDDKISVYSLDKTSEKSEKSLGLMAKIKKKEKEKGNGDNDTDKECSETEGTPKVQRKTKKNANNRPFSSFTEHDTEHEGEGKLGRGSSARQLFSWPTTNRRHSLEH